MIFMERPKTWARSRSLRIKGFDYSTPGRAYHVVIGSKDRQPRFATNELNVAILQTLKSVAEACDYRLVCCCLMPDHLHVLAQAGDAPKMLSKMVRDFKVFSSKNARVALWQRGFYEHIVRTDEILETIALYIIGNPVRAGLAEDPKEWPWSIRSW